jgi:hypothetical protein
LPKDVAFGTGDEDVGVVDSGKVDELLPIRLVIINGNEVGVLGGGNIFAHAMENHGTNERRGPGQNGELVVRNMGVRSVIRKEALVPGSAVLAAFVGEAENEDQKLLAAGFGQDDFGIVESFRFDGRNGLREESGSRSENGEAESGDERKTVHRCPFDGLNAINQMRVDGKAMPEGGSRNFSPQTVRRKGALLAKLGHGSAVPLRKAKRCPPPACDGQAYLDRQADCGRYTTLGHLT